MHVYASWKYFKVFTSLFLWQASFPDCDWLRNTFSGPLFAHVGDPLLKNKRMHFKTKQQN
jgi:hypothetical protein